MRNAYRSFLCLLLAAGMQVSESQTRPVQDVIEIAFSEGSNYSFAAPERAQISRIIESSAQRVRALLPQLPGEIRVEVFPIDRDLTGVGGATGRADTAHRVVIYVSTVYPGGVNAAAAAGLAATVFHEFHHLARGWTIEGNRFGPGIPIAAVNEGLANVFSETYTDTAFEGYAYPDDVDAWFTEIMALPRDANYNQWMNQHPDGRQAIGYRVGSYIIHRAMEASQKPILELSRLSPQEILALLESPAESEPRQ